MRKFYLFIISLLPVLLFTSCSSTGSCVSNKNFRIDLYSGGGFTGMESGVTVSCEGWVKFWKNSPNSIRQVTDSVKISEEKFKKIINLLDNPVLLSYHSNYSGNYNTYLVIIKDIQLNKISFNQSDPPADLPSVFSDLINVIKSIKN